VAQGAEAGGHGEGRGTMPFVPAVVDVAGATPVLAAGGVADGRGLAAALVLGAAGALIGTRFEATTEALLSAEEQKAIITAAAADTVRDRVLDIAVDSPWPARFTARTLRNRFTDTWHDDEAGLQSNTEAKAEFAAGVTRGDMDYVPVWAGEAVDLITELDTAAALVARIADEAARAISGAHDRIRGA
jgi:nitronate monooxygenase